MFVNADNQTRTLVMGRTHMLCAHIHCTYGHLRISMYVSTYAVHVCTTMYEHPNYKDLGRDIGIKPVVRRTVYAMYTNFARVRQGQVIPKIYLKS